MNSVAYDPDRGSKVWWLIIQTAYNMHRARGKELLQYGITPEEAAVLSVVQAIGKRATVSEISRRISRERHSTSSLISRMENDGLIRKGKDLDKKNMIRVSMTEKGQQAYNQSSKRESIHRIMPVLSGEEFIQLSSYLRKLRDKALEERGITNRQTLLSMKRTKSPEYSDK